MGLEKVKKKRVVLIVAEPSINILSSIVYQ